MGQLDPSHSWRMVHDEPFESHVAVVVVRTDLGMSPSVVAAEASRALAETVAQLTPDQMHAWRLSGRRVVMLQTHSDASLRQAFFDAVLLRGVPHWLPGVGNHRLTDDPRNATSCLAVGPGPLSALGPFISGRPLL